MLRLIISIIFVFSLYSCNKKGLNLDASDGVTSGRGPGSCKRSGMVVGSIINGVRTQENKWSSVVGITLQDKMHCSGTLVAPKLVLTAAHCIKLKNQYYKIPAEVFKVYFGTGTKEDVSTPFFVEKTLIHPKYGGGSFSKDYDLALMILKEKAPIKESSIIPVITAKELKRNIKSGSPITIVGFGKTENDCSGIKYEVGSRITEVTTTEFIDSGPRKGACHGDSGGPIFSALKNSKLKTIGVTSRGTGHCFGTVIYGKANLMLSKYYSGQGHDLFNRREYLEAAENYNQSYRYESKTEVLFFSGMSYFLADQKEQAKKKIFKYFRKNGELGPKSLKLKREFSDFKDFFDELHREFHN
jgi:secreted trypsin-like serine protease